MSRSLEDVQDEILDRLHAGHPVDREALIAEHPQHADALRAFFQVLDVVEGPADAVGPAPATLGEFRILREIGRGGMGVVYEAEQASLKRRVALKVLPPTLRMDTRLVSRFRREAEAAGRLRHPGIVPVFSVGEAAGAPFFAMELVEGTSLQQVLKARRAGQDAGLPTDPEAWRRWTVETVAKVADALAYAHAQGILHRDVKPGNILLDASGAPRLTDFGLARDLRAPGLSQTGEVFGSPQYMSPEQAVRREAPVDGRTDVYSLAVTLYELLTLRLPYEAATHAELFTALAAGRVTPPRKVEPAIPRPLEDVLLRALRRDPAERYADAGRFAADLRAALEGRAVARAGPSWRRLAATWLVGLACVSAVLWWAYEWADVPEDAPTTTTGEAEGSRGSMGRARSDLPPAPAPPVGDRTTELDEILRAYGTRPTRAGQYREVIDALKAIDSPAARLALQRVYRDFIEGPGRDDKEAREALGYTEFPHAVPEDIAYRDYPYLRAVAAAERKRWFEAGEMDYYKLALQAWQRTLEHRERLIHDRHFRAVDGVRAMLANDPTLKDYSLMFRWAEPYLIGYVSSDKMSIYELLAGDDVSGWAEQIPGIEARRRRAEVVLEDQASIFTQLHREYMRRYQAKLHLRPLMDEYGGRPDYPIGVRSFQDGCPLLVLVFDGDEPWIELVRKLYLGSPRGASGALFSPRTSCLYVKTGAQVSPNRAFEIGRRLHEGIHQLQFWFTRQRNNWRKPIPSQGWEECGIADYLAGAKMRADGRLEFSGISAPRLRNMQSTARMLEQQGNDYRVYPLAKLVGFTAYAEVQSWGASNWQLAPAVVLGLYRDQAWALAHFLNHAEDGRYRERFEKFYDLVLHREVGYSQGSRAFEEAFRIRDVDDWDALDEAFRAYVRDHLLKLDPSAFDYEPPPPGDPERK